MFDVAPTELLLVAVVALLVIGPKDLPRAMRFVGQWVAKARGVARHFRTGIDEMIRQAELEEMEKKWAAENERIMREHPPQPALTDANAVEEELLPVGGPPESSAPPPDDGPALPNAATADLFDSAPAEPSSRPPLP
ncbi:MAG: Sec-independent protein translocase protein TatB [Rhizorhabdus sp.]